jgi:polar amino acid transport system permease protein
MLTSLPPPFDLVGGLLPGVLVTIQITLGGAVVAGVVAFAAGLARLSESWPLRVLAITYIDLFRGTSALVQLFWAYFALPLLGLELDAMTVGVSVLGLNIGAYGAEVVRGAIQSVPDAQHEAAAALNFTRHQTMWRIVVPQALLSMLPPFGNLLIELLKSTALVSLITLSDLTFQGQLLRTATLRSGEIFGWILLLYFLLAMAISQSVRRLERRLAVGRDHGGTL